MTAIASISIENHRILVGDLALSNDPKYYSSIRRIPTRQNHSNIYPPDSPIIILDLMQKTFSINKDIVLAWCGEVYEARKVVERLKYEFEDNLFNRDEYRNIIKELEGDVDFKSIGYLIHFMDGDQLGIIGKNCLSVDNEFVDIPNYFCGSGEDELSRVNELAMQQGIKEPNAYISALFCHIIGADLYTPSVTLEKLFGGGFEAVVRKEEGFVKYDGMTIFVWEAVFENKKTDGLSCVKIIKQYYHNDLLYIKEIVLDMDDTQPFWLHVVGNILQNSCENDAEYDEHNDLFSERQINVIYMIDKDIGYFQSHIKVDTGKEYHLVDVEFDVKGEISFSMNKERMDNTIININKSASKYYDSRK